ncbi:hypothetical protein AMECASPLE_026944 [Ameca splendens]|uniref:Fibronectin type-III domain-containing protein n=1 Tax=Ameca splendens TaxID=208324 RepID=A0ABV0YG84_9TELE
MIDVWDLDSGYLTFFLLFCFSRPETGGQQKRVELAKQETNLVIKDFDPSKEYNFKIFAVNKGKESKPLQGKYEAQQLGSQTAQTLGGKKSDVTRENNEISEGKMLSGKQKANRVK